MAGGFAFGAGPAKPRAKTLAAVLILLFLIGHASQRAGVCMVRAMREVIERRRAHRCAGLAFAAACAMAVMALAKRLGAHPFATIADTPPDPLSLAGGVLFGLGALLAGHCAMGLLAGLTRGESWRGGAIAAMFLPALLRGPHISRAALMLPERLALPAPLAGRPWLGLALALALGGPAAGHIHRRLGWKRPRGGWSPLLAMGLIGAVSGLLFARDRQWVETSRIAELAYGEGWSAGGSPALRRCSRG
jgi:hypothetical protein